MDDVAFLGSALSIAREGLRAGQVPVGAAMVREGRLLEAAHNTVWRDLDPTGHAEMNVIRLSARAVQGIFLRGCTAYCTLEPCPMCMSAFLWTQVDRIVYGASITDAVKVGFPELWVPSAELAMRARRNVRIEQCVECRDECLALFQEWRAAGSPRHTAGKRETS
ncbi:MAG: nucleoside deaminase [Planctomycetes bacterium]|nr:nucleoside deaminase [Planctomycetota bacterium]